MTLLELQRLTGLEGDVITILEQTEVLTGKPIEFVRDDSLWILASVHMARSFMPAHVIRFRKADPVVLAHLIAHECGHVQRLFAAPPEKRLVPVTRPEHVDRVFRILAADARVALDFRDERVARELFTIWHQGMVSQVVNLNVDYRIESWLYQKYPGMRPNQAASVAKQVRLSVAGLEPDVERFTPRIVYVGSNAVNYAYFLSVGIMLGQNLVGDYSDSSIVALGRRLGAILEEPDTGFEGDVRESNQWAAALGIGKWFDWQAFEEIPG
ncbi:MAG TPA: hypothetical protein VIK22_01195 [Candidatus Anoxymicrobiaceae bacterium]